MLARLKSKTGLTPNILARFALCLSLKDPSIPNPDEFDEYKAIGLELGFRHVESSALVRSSYKAQKHIN